MALTAHLLDQDVQNVTNDTYDCVIFAPQTSEGKKRDKSCLSITAVQGSEHRRSDKDFSKQLKENFLQSADEQLIE